MKLPKTFYLVAAVIGTVVPWFFFTLFFIREGINIPLFVQGLFANGASGGFCADILISIGIFLVWSYSDARQNRIANWWVVLPASFLVGLSLALPLYLYLRSND